MRRFQWSAFVRRRSGYKRATFVANPLARRTLKPSTRWPACDAELWVKGISSDGSREGSPDAGQAYPENVVRMYHRALPKLPVVW